MTKPTLSVVTMPEWVVTISRNTQADTSRTPGVGPNVPSFKVTTAAEPIQQHAHELLLSIRSLSENRFQVSALLIDPQTQSAHSSSANRAVALRARSSCQDACTIGPSASVPTASGVVDSSMGWPICRTIGPSA